MKRYLMLLLLFAPINARLWVYNLTPYYIKFVAETTIGDEVIDKIKPRYARWVKDPQFAFAFYKKYHIYRINNDGSTTLLLEKEVNEGGNRKIEIKFNGKSETIYIAQDSLEARIPEKWAAQELSFF